MWIFSLDMIRYFEILLRQSYYIKWMQAMGYGIGLKKEDEVVVLSEK